MLEARDAAGARQPDAGESSGGVLGPHRRVPYWSLNASRRSASVNMPQ